MPERPYLQSHLGSALLLPVHPLLAVRCWQVVRVPRKRFWLQMALLPAARNFSKKSLRFQAIVLGASYGGMTIGHRP